MRDSVAARAARKIRYHYVVAFDKDEAEEQMKEVRKIFRRGDEIVFIVWD